MEERMLGPIRRWKDGDIFVAENDWIRLTWAVTNDPAKIGHFGFHGPREIGVEFISPETGAIFEKRWAETVNT